MPPIDPPKAQHQRSGSETAFFAYQMAHLCFLDACRSFPGGLHCTWPLSFLETAVGLGQKTLQNRKIDSSELQTLPRLSCSDHCCIRLDQAVILDPGWPKMAQGIKNGTHFSAQHGVQLQDGGQGGGRGFQVWCCNMAFKVWRGALELVFMLPNQAGGCNHPCACLHARMCMCHFWIRQPNGPFCAHLYQAPARSTAASFGPLGCWGAGPMAQGGFCQLKSASGCFHSWKRP